ncbi:MAG: SRPBCC family protein [Nevskiales bacterium]|nr:SRPBCC family protein [Nevskiales bacterium]
MPAQEVRLHAHINAPVERVFAFFADHEKFATLFGGSCRRVRDGEGDPNGLHSVRRMGPGPLAFDETITEFVPNERIAYQISRGGPLKNHLGVIRFSATGDATDVDYVIRFDGKLPGVGPLVAKALSLAWHRSSPRALAALERA